MANWWDTTAPNQNYVSWWNKFGAGDQNENPDIGGGDDSPYSSRNFGTVWDNLVNPTGSPGGYGAMSPYMYKNTKDQMDQLQSMFELETIGGLSNTNNNNPYLTNNTSEQFTSYLKSRLNPYGHTAGEGIGSSAQTGGQKQPLGYTYGVEQSQQITRQALQNMIQAYQTAANKDEQWRGYTGAGGAVSTRMTQAYKAAYDALKAKIESTLDTDGVTKLVANEVNGLTMDNIKKLLLSNGEDVQLQIGRTAANMPAYVNARMNWGTENQQTSIRRILNLLGPKGTEAKPGWEFDPSGFTVGNANTLLQSIANISANPNIASLINMQAPGAQQLEALQAIMGAAGNKGRNFTGSNMANTAAEEAAQFLSNSLTTGTAANPFYDQIRNGLGNAYGGIYRNAALSQFDRELAGRVDSAAGSQAGENILDTLMEMFNKYAGNRGGA
jgi:hypothetical protein